MKIKRNNLIDRIFENMYNEMESLNGMFNNVEFPKNVESGKPYFYGYTMEVGPDGQPVVNTFGNADQFNGSTAGSRPQNVSESQDPAVDVLESKKDNSIKIIVEMPGVTKENIKVTENQGMVNITAENGDRKYNKNIPTGKKLDADKSKANYLNGILELKIPLRKSEEEKNIRID